MGERETTVITEEPLDEFFEQKTLEKDADNYLLESLFDQLTPDKRRAMYAATWVLMALTRSMENCYIQLQNTESSLSKAILSFKEKYPMQSDKNTCHKKLSNGYAIYFKGFLTYQKINKNKNYRQKHSIPN